MEGFNWGAQGVSRKVSVIGMMNVGSIGILGVLGINLDKMSYVSVRIIMN